MLLGLRVIEIDDLTTGDLDWITEYSKESSSSLTNSSIEFEDWSELKKKESLAAAAEVDGVMCSMLFFLNCALLFRVGLDFSTGDKSFPKNKYNWTEQI